MSDENVVELSRGASRSTMGIVSVVGLGGKYEIWDLALGSCHRWYRFERDSDLRGSSGPELGVGRRTASSQRAAATVGSLWALVKLIEL